MRVRRPAGSRGGCCTGSRNLFVTLWSGGRRIGAWLGGGRPTGRAKISLKLERFWNRKCRGGGAACAGAGRLREVAAPWRAPVCGAALCSAPGGRVFAPCSGSEEVYLD